MQTLQPGSQLSGGTYRIEKILGQGSFGITYLATTRLTTQGKLGKMDVEAKVAIKEFFMSEVNSRKSDGSSVDGSSGSVFTNYRQKFRKEAENLSRLSHPNIVKVFDVFDENNTTYYVMEFLEGTNLDDYIGGKGRLSEEESIAAIKEVGGALAYMHSRKMLHLDIKPKNIMRRSDGRYCLIDFGLSKQYTEGGEPESSTSIGLGTPGYAPIEQSGYKQDGTFPATLDVYALGATMYKMLTGKRPPEATYILNEGFPKTALSDSGASNQTVAAVEKAMAPIKKNRYQSVSAFLQEVGDLTSEDNTIIGTVGKRSEDYETNPRNRPNQEPSGKADKRTPISTNSTVRKTKRMAIWIGVTAVAVILAIIIWRFNTNRGNTTPSPYIDTTLYADTTYVDTEAAAQVVEPIQPIEEEAVATAGVEDTYSKAQFKRDFNTSDCEIYNIRIGNVGCKMYYYAYGPEDAYAAILLNGRLFKFKGGQDEGISSLKEMGGSGSLYLDWNISSGDMKIGAMRYNILLP